MNAGVLIVFPYARMDAHPTMRNLLRVLIERWAFVHVVCASGDVRLTSDSNVDACLFPSQSHSGLNPQVGRGSFLDQPLARIRASLAPRRFAMQRGGYAAIVGVDPEGLIQAQRLNRYARLPLVYLSFEIMFRDEIAGTPLDAVKAREIAASRDAKLVLIQDEERGQALCEQNEISPERLAFVPNGPASEEVGRGTYLRDRLGIPSDKRIVLYAGNLRTWGSRDLFDEMTHFWPERYVLVLHHWAKADSFLQRYLDRLRKTGRVYVSGEPVPADRLTSLYASADFGLAPFKPTPDYWDSGGNIYHMGLSSGKVGYYAMCKLPMVASDIPVFRCEFESYRCGGVYTSIAQTGDILERLDGDYAHHSEEAGRFYRERMDPAVGLRQFADRLQQLVQ